MDRQIHTKRVYDPPARGDGKRVLVDGLWPRGMRKQDAALDLWLKEIAPSSELRKWYGHKPELWPEFVKRYEKELAAHKGAVAELVRLAGEGPLTLLYAARDGEHSNAAALARYLARRLPRA